MDREEVLDYGRLQGAVQAAVRYITSTSSYNINKRLLLDMLDVEGIGLSDRIKEEDD